MIKKTFDQLFKIKLSDNSLDVLDRIVSIIICDTENNKYVLINYLRLINEGELEGFHYILLKYLQRLKTLMNTMQIKEYSVTREGFKSHLNINVNRYVKDQNVNVQGILASIQEAEMPNTAEGQIKTKQLIIAYCLQYFDKLVALNVKATESAQCFDNLISSVLEDYSIASLQIGAQIIESKVDAKGESVYGSEDYFEFQSACCQEVKRKKATWNSLTSNIFMIKSLADLNRLSSEEKFVYKPICKYGIPPIDAVAPIQTSTIITLVGMAGVGKTSYMCTVICREILSGYTVIVMTGESFRKKILFSVLAHYIFLRTRTSDDSYDGLELNWKDIESEEALSNLDETKQAIVRQCKYELFESGEYGKIIPVKQFTYNNFKEEIQNIMDEHPDEKFGHTFIDHTKALRIDNGAGKVWLKDVYDAVPYLYSQIKELRTDYGYGFFVLSHPSSSSKKQIDKGEDGGSNITAASSAGVDDSDEVHLLSATPELKRQGMAMWTVKKFREYEESSFKPTLLKLQLTACVFVYSEELQKLIAVEDKKAVASSKEIEELAGNNPVF